jgi:hypothetical protein
MSLLAAHMHPQRQVQVLSPNQISHAHERVTRPTLRSARCFLLVTRVALPHALAPAFASGRPTQKVNS